MAEGQDNADDILDQVQQMDSIAPEATTSRSNEVLLSPEPQEILNNADVQSSDESSKGEKRRVIRRRRKSSSSTRRRSSSVKGSPTSPRYQKNYKPGEAQQIPTGNKYPQGGIQQGSAARGHPVPGSRFPTESSKGGHFPGSHRAHEGKGRRGEAGADDEPISDDEAEGDDSRKRAGKSGKQVRLMEADAGLQGRLQYTDHVPTYPELVPHIRANLQKYLEGRGKAPPMDPRPKESPGGAESAKAYLERHAIAEMLRLMMTSLLNKLPDQPLDFLIDMAHEMNQQRSIEEHVTSVVAEP